jgi:hypothetical protein
MLKTFTIKSSSSSTQSSTLFQTAKFFKYELIKVLIFLLLFGASIFFVNSVSHQYYKKDKSGLMEK